MTPRLASVALLTGILRSFTTASIEAQTIAGGSGHTVVLKPDGTVWTFGLNNNGQLGDNTTTARKSPIAVGGLSSVVAVAAGSVHSLALTSGGEVWAWGDNAYGQLGDASTTDRKTPVQTAMSGPGVTASQDDWEMAPWLPGQRRLMCSQPEGYGVERPHHG
jgi:alpha-tubulin suppressor-like RCC1 family protein